MIPARNTSRFRSGFLILPRFVRSGAAEVERLEPVTRLPGGAAASDGLRNRLGSAEGRAGVCNVLLILVEFATGGAGVRRRSMVTGRLIPGFINPSVDLTCDCFLA